MFVLFAFAFAFSRASCALYIVRFERFFHLLALSGHAIQVHISIFYTMMHNSTSKMKRCSSSEASYHSHSTRAETIAHTIPAESIVLISMILDFSIRLLSTQWILSSAFHLPKIDKLSSYSLAVHSTLVNAGVS